MQRYSSSLRYSLLSTLFLLAADYVVALLSVYLLNERSPPEFAEKMESSAIVAPMAKAAVELVASSYRTCMLRKASCTLLTIRLGHSLREGGLRV